MAPRAVNHGGELPLASLIERGAELKRALVDFALSPRCERHLERFMLETTDPWQELSEGEAIGVIDRFALQHRLPNGKTVLDQFLASRPDLTAADREMLRGWRHPVEGIFEIRRKDLDALVLLNLIDDLEYRAYSNMGPPLSGDCSKADSCTSASCHLPRPRRLAGLRVDVGLPQGGCCADRAGRARGGDETARTGLP